MDGGGGNSSGQQWNRVTIGSYKCLYLYHSGIQLGDGDSMILLEIK